MKRLVALLAFSAPLFAQTPSTDPDANAPAASPAQNRQPKPLPPPGVAIPEPDRAELAAGVAELGKELLPLASNPLYADAAVFHKAVDWALRYDEFYNVKEVATARELLKEGRARVAALKAGTAPWTTQTGLVVRGYRSKIDGSVQPFGVVVPATWKGAADKTPRATWIWNHGRSETLTELAFIAQRMKSAGEFTPPDTFVVHPYGRYCNATKFAGEVDVFEALDSAKKAYPVDSERLVNAGFSMGGASAWHLAVHHSGLWAASHAGAGFAETAEYAGVFAAGKTPPPWWEVILYRWYDATVCAGNLANHPMIAYYGEQDKQKQATQIMKRFAEKEGVNFEEFVGPGVGHKYEPSARKAIESRIKSILGKRGTPAGRQANVNFTSYGPMHYQSTNALVLRRERSWELAEAKWALSADGKLNVYTSNVTELAITPPDGNNSAVRELIVDGTKLQFPATENVLSLLKVDGHWNVLLTGTPSPRVIEMLATKAKHPGLCGPIDHAFMSSFVFVKPTGAPLNAALGEWTQRELAHATKQWRGIFRGDAPTVDDTKITDAQIKNSHLILWGDPSSNAVLKRIADKLPVKWTAQGVEFGGKKYSPNHVPVLIFPNPLNAQRYVVLNSGFTFSRAASSGTNSQQTPKLPDWAIVDTSVPPDDKFPGKIADAGFFDEQWRFTTERPK